MATAVRAITHDEVQAEPVAEFFIFDVETRNPDQEHMKRLEADFLEDWEPSGNLKDPEKIEGARAAALLKFRDKAALLDAAPVSMVGIMFSERVFLLHGLKREKPKWFGKRERNVSIEGFPNERTLIEAVYAVLEEETTEKMQGVGHNIFGFDLSKLRLAGVRNGLTLPDLLRVVMDEDEDRRRFVDTMSLFTKYFSKRGELFISQDRMLERLGIESLLKDVATGADVPRLLAENPPRINEVATKLLADLVGNRDAFLKMTSRVRK
jgi:hypothetical protein